MITARDAPIHASGHGYAEEVKMMINLTRPRYVMPVHGDFKRMLMHSELAQAVGIPEDHIFRTENGTPLEIDADGARLGEKVQAGMIFVDGVDIGDIADVALRDRRMLSADGVLVIVATIKEEDGSSVVPPEVIARGVPFADDAEIPGTWLCRNGMEGTLVEGDVPEPKKVKPPRTHWDMLLERRSVEELEELLRERLDIIKARRRGN